MPAMEKPAASDTPCTPCDSAIKLHAICRVLEKADQGAEWMLYVLLGERQTIAVSTLPCCKAACQIAVAARTAATFVPC
jgi:hypothetical protein